MSSRPPSRRIFRSLKCRICTSLEIGQRQSVLCPSWSLSPAPEWAETSQLPCGLGSGGSAKCLRQPGAAGVWPRCEHWVCNNVHPRGRWTSSGVANRPSRHLIVQQRRVNLRGETHTIPRQGICVTRGRRAAMDYIGLTMGKRKLQRHAPLRHYSCYRGHENVTDATRGRGTAILGARLPSNCCCFWELCRGMRRTYHGACPCPRAAAKPLPPVPCL